ncbi:MAG TPA: glycerol kinase GlpK [Tepidisphaeraceae bacterium]|nr:glycerol kinase GlpK [Tepidisphaeraceae bacterium]
MPPPPLVAAIDQGTTSTRCIVFSESEAVAVAQKEHRQIYPRPGWVEHDASEIWQRAQEVVSEAVAASRASGRGEIAAVGITNQRETAVVWDRRTGRPLHNAIVWQDTRTQDLCDALAREGGAGPDRFRPKTGLPLATYFSATKLRWILDRVPGARAAGERGDALFGTVDSWLIWNLTGGASGGQHVTDVTNASRTLLMNLATLDWDDELLSAFHVPRAMLPRITSSSVPGDGFGATRADGPLGAELPVCGNLGDQQAALVGQACFTPGDCKNTYGTGCFMLLHTGDRAVASKAGLLTTVGYRFGDEPAAYALEGSIAVTGALVQWLRDNLKIISASPEIEPLAASVTDNGGVYFVPAFSGLFAPRWRADARGTIVGMTGHSHRGHIARAALEATAYQTRDVLEAMRDDAGVALSVLKVDGGMTGNELLMQFQADVLGIPVARPKVMETTALGAAVAAARAQNLWPERPAIQSPGGGKTWEPKMGRADRDRLYDRWLAAVERSLGWVEAGG